MKHLHEKRLAVLETVLDRKLSVREASKIHGVDRKSATRWLVDHEQGVLTLEMLRRKNLVPTEPVRDDHALTRRQQILKEDLLEWREMGEELKRRLLREREVTSSALADIEAELGDLDRRMRGLA